MIRTNVKLYKRKKESVKNEAMRQSFVCVVSVVGFGSPMVI